MTAFSGRADLVAHVGQEGALGPAGGFGRLFGAAITAALAARQLGRPLLDADLQVVVCPANLFFLLFAAEQLPHPLHQERQLPDVGIVVGRGLVAHAGHDHDPLAVEDRGIHVPQHLDVPFRVSLLQRVGGLVVVGDDRFRCRTASPHSPVSTTG